MTKNLLFIWNFLGEKNILRLCNGLSTRKESVFRHSIYVLAMIWQILRLRFLLSLLFVYYYFVSFLKLFYSTQR